MLSITTLKDYEEGFFVFLFPSQNTECQTAVKNYIAQLNNDNEEVNGFYARHLEQFVETIGLLCPEDWARELRERYFGE